jgi:hypothetical protein
MHTGGVRGDKSVPSLQNFAKLVNKNAIKHQKVVPSTQNFHNPYIPSLPKFGNNLPDPPPGFSNRVHENNKFQNLTCGLRTVLLNRGSVALVQGFFPDIQ